MSHLTASAGSRKKKGHGGVAGYMYAQTGTPLNSFSWQTASQIRTSTTVRILRSLDFPFAQPTTCSTGNAPVWVACYPTIIIVVFSSSRSGGCGRFRYFVMPAQKEVLSRWELVLLKFCPRSKLQVLKTTRRFELQPMSFILNPSLKQ